MTVRVFVDGGAGTTGIEIVERLSGRADVALSLLPDDRRKDAAARADALAAADIAILCLPDDAAREAVALAEGLPTRFIDASTAHRTADGWTYGFAEIEPMRRAELKTARFVSNPGCYPTGFLALVRPLVGEGLLPADTPLSVNAASGYSGGGKAMIAEFEANGPAPTAFRPYGLNLAHKHVPEMQQHAGLALPPIFAPAVVNAYRGMLVEVPLHLSQFGTPYDRGADPRRACARPMRVRRSSASRRWPRARRFPASPSSMSPAPIGWRCSSSPIQRPGICVSSRRSTISARARAGPRCRTST